MLNTKDKAIIRDFVRGKMPDRSYNVGGLIHSAASKPIINKEKALMHQSNKKIFIGADFQATLPALLRTSEKSVIEKDDFPKATLMWKPSDDISEDQLDALIRELKPRGLHEDQILAFLCYKKYNIDETLLALNNTYIGTHEGMPLHDKVIFAQGYGFHGKNFDRIRDLLPRHTLQTLINHYYTEFKRSKQNRLTANRPETEVRKLTRDATESATTKYGNGKATSCANNPRLRIRESPTTSGAAELTDLMPGCNLLSIKLPEIPIDLVSGMDDYDANINAEERLVVKISTEKIRFKELTELRRKAIDDLKTASLVASGPADTAVQNIVQLAKDECHKEPTPVWQQSEITIFMKALVEFGTDFAKASHLLPTKTEQQLRNMYYNRQHLYKLDKLVQFHQERTAAAAASTASV